MWACTPTSSTPGRSSSAATASAAAPEETEKPNLESSCPVRTNSWVCASTPGVTRTRTARPVPHGRGRLQQAAQPGDLVEGVDHDAADAVLERGGQLARRLVVAVHDEALRRHTGRERDVELAARRDVEVHALLVGQAGHGPAQEGLGGVRDAVAPGGHRLPAGLAQVVLVVDEQRRAEFLGQLEQVDTPDMEVALLVDGGRAREQTALRSGGGDVVVGRHGSAGYGSLRALREPAGPPPVREDYDRPLLVHRTGTPPP